MKIEFLSQPGESTVGERLVSELAGETWNGFLCAVAYAKISGVRHLDPPLRRFVGGGGWVEVSVGVDSGGTSFEALSQLAGAVSPRGRVVVVRDPASPAVSFHPKVYVFVKGEKGAPERALLIVGSNNLTEGGLFSNHEASYVLALDTSDPADVRLLDEVLVQLDKWHDEASLNSAVGSTHALLDLHREGLLPSEREMAKERGQRSSSIQIRQPSRRSVAPKPTGRMGPPIVELPQPTEEVPAKDSSAVGSESPHLALFIDITKADKTEIHLSKTALDDDPAFFGYPFTGKTRPRRGNPQPKREPSPVVDIELIGESDDTIATYADQALSMWYYTPKQELRITIPKPLLDQLPDKCLLEMRRRPVRAGIDYKLVFISPSANRWDRARQRATRSLQGRKRRMGWE